MKRIILCADDYSQSPAINRAILELVGMGRLDAVSSLTLSPTWHSDARNLKIAGSAQHGLHFNLTLPFSQPERRVSCILAAAMLGKLDRKMIRSAFEKQWNGYTRAMGSPPDFVDGHQHVHVFPTVRDVVMECLSEFGSKCWVRTLQPPVGLQSGPFKKHLLERMSRSLTDKLEEAGIATNQYFAGFRSYRSAGKFRQSFNRWINASDESLLIMCHPGRPSSDLSDPIRESRVEEFHYLTSEYFRSDRESALRSSPDSIFTEPAS